VPTLFFCRSRDLRSTALGISTSMTAHTGQSTNPSTRPPAYPASATSHAPCSPAVEMSKGRAAADSVVKLIVGAGTASAGPPVGPALGSKGVKSIDFVKVGLDALFSGRYALTACYHYRNSMPGLLTLHRQPRCP